MKFGTLAEAIGCAEAEQQGPRRRGRGDEMDQANAGEPYDMLRNPKFQELTKQRSAFAWTLSVVMVVVYVGFILLVAFDRGLLATKIGGGTTSLGILLGLAVIVIAFGLTGIYVVRANGRYDAMTRDLAKDLP